MESPLVYENGSYTIDFADFERRIVEEDVKGLTFFVKPRGRDTIASVLLNCIVSSMIYMLRQYHRKVPAVLRNYIHFDREPPCKLESL